MHPIATTKSWSHHLHDSMLATGHRIVEHLHSRHFWTGVGLTLLLIGIVTLLFIAAKNAPFVMPDVYPYGIPYGT
jgi:hypothetical protein